MKTSPSVAERLALNSRRTSDGCMLWTLGVEGDGYGIIHLNGRSRRVHRIAWKVENGPIPPGLHVLHKCDVRPCINPDHLFLGTNVDNMKDRNAKGRQARGERQSLAKLTAEAIHLIRSDPRPGTVIGPLYGVCARTIQHVRRGRTWGHV